MLEKFNYIVTNDRIYDLQYLLPFTHLGTGEYESPHDMKMSINEKKLSADK